MGTPVPDDDDSHEQLLDHSTRTRTASASALTSTNVTKKVRKYVPRRANVTAGTTGVATDATTLNPRARVTSVTTNTKWTQAQSMATPANASQAITCAPTRPPA